MGYGKKAKEQLGDAAFLEQCGAFRKTRHLFKLLPRDPRCRVCCIPFRGVGLLLRGTGWGPSRKNPNFCRWCLEWLPEGGYEAEVGVLFADVRGFTERAESMRPEDVARLLNRFYLVASSVVVANDALVDKLMGDEVMALFLTGLAGPDCFEKMALTAEGLLRGVGYGSQEGAWLPLGVAMDFGLAFVGNVGSGGVTDFTAVGDVVNTAARLQGEAKPGQIVISERTYQQVSKRYPNARHMDLELKGKSEPVSAYAVDFPEGAIGPPLVRSESATSTSH